MPRRSPRKASVAATALDVKAETVAVKSKAQQVKSRGKRPAPDDEDDDDFKKESSPEIRKEAKLVKKRKTGTKKDETEMPLAARTAIATLKRPMYIGAHISAAGGTCVLLSW